MWSLQDDKPDSPQREDENNALVIIYSHPAVAQGTSHDHYPTLLSIAVMVTVGD
jgi:hypothetical protein